jgi:DNA-binding Xre family transcriptional regulator
MLRLRIKEMRERKGWDLWDVARALGLNSISNLEKYEKNRFKHLDAKLIHDLCIVLECELSEIMVMDEKPLVLNAIIEER